MTEFLLRLHRWAALILAPLFAVILFSGGLLALEPILGQGDSRPRATVDVAALTTLLERSPIAQRARGRGGTGRRDGGTRLRSWHDGLSAAGWTRRNPAWEAVLGQ
jgi:uncharacterized iron-regulated membrane protein